MRKRRMHTSDASAEAKPGAAAGGPAAATGYAAVGEPQRAAPRTCHVDGDGSHLDVERSRPDAPACAAGAWWRCACRTAARCKRSPSSERTCLNAELTDALEREGHEPKLADELLQALCEEEQFITAGPDQAT